MKNSAGAAIKITESNRKKLAVVNGGIIPDLEDITTYFVFPYDFNAHTEILKEVDFRKKYRFANTPNENYLVDVDEL